MSWLGDVFKFENFNLNNQWGKLKKNPERAFIGAMDEGSTKVWNKAFDWTAPITGIHRHYEPMTDYFGGASKDSYTKAGQAGINTGPGRSMHNVAKAITSAYVGGYGAGQLGAGAGGAQTGMVDASGNIIGGGAEGAAYGSGAGGTAGGAGSGAGDVWAGWSPSGSSASGSPSTLSPSSSNPAAYTDPYAAQDVMQQARDTSIATGEAGAWNNPANSSGASGAGKGLFNRQMLAQSLRGLGNMGGQKPQQPPLEIYEEQPDFLQVAQAAPIQEQGYASANPYILFGNEDKMKLAQALRN